MQIIARPIHFTSNLPAVTKRLHALGLTRLVGADGDCWQVFSAPAGGRVGVHQVEPDNWLDGVSKLGFEVPSTTELRSLSASFAEQPSGAVADLVNTGHGEALQITARDGLQFLVDVGEQIAAEWSPAPSVDGVEGVEVAQMWFTSDTAAAREVLLRLGAQELVTTSTLGWDDARLPGGGRTQLHDASGGTRVSLGFMSAQPLEQLKAKVDLGGDDASIVDEAWGRYLDLAPVTVNKPETGLEGELTWVNEEKTDYYGYQVHQDPLIR